MNLRPLILSLSVLLSSPLLQSEDWPRWLGPETNGISGEVLPEQVDLTNRVWTAEIGIGFSSVSVAGGRVYSMGHRDGEETVSCLSEADGSLLWSDSYEAELMPNLHEGGPGATPTVDGDHVYTMSKDGQLRVYEADSGALVWKKEMPAISGMREIPEWGFTASPLIEGDTVFVEAGATFAFDKKTGEELWRSDDYRPAYGTPQLFEADGRALLAVLKTDGLVILDPANGKTLAFSMWRTSFQTNSTTPLSAGDGRLFISTGYDQGCALFRFSEGKLSKLYENKNMCNHMGNSVLIDGCLYGFDGTAHRGRPVEFTAIDLETGEKKWHFEDLKYGSVIAAGQDLIVLTERGEILIGPATPAGFEARVRHSILSGRCWTPPVLANGVIYARNASGMLVAIRVR
ncbi:MAG: PQQ-like beta-propeller repeat protein [Verrucomicrobiales bacterium]|nr:PQQ-like beta-propeller repeat protein [Verrucomicrobiales bacterium]